MNLTKTGSFKNIEEEVCGDVKATPSALTLKYLKDVSWVCSLLLHRKLCLPPRMRRDWSKSTMSSSSCLLHITGQLHGSLLLPAGLKFKLHRKKQTEAPLRKSVVKLLIFELLFKSIKTAF